jgi:manganese-dependent inorganic pyrophosphatase
MYKENKVVPPRDIAGIMMSGIISDTLLFHSPTTTEMDKLAVLELSKICNVDPKEFSEKMFTEASSIKGKTIEEIIYGDFKSFNINKNKIGVGQITVIDVQEALKNKNNYIKTLDKLSIDKEFDILLFCITDVINSNTYVLFNNKAKLMLEAVFDNEKLEQGFCLKGVVSRKKQIIPLLMDELN